MGTEASTEAGTEAGTGAGAVTSSSALVKVHGSSRLAFGATTAALVTLASGGTAVLVAHATHGVTSPTSLPPGALPSDAASHAGGLVVDTPTPQPVDPTEKALHDALTRRPQPGRRTLTAPLVPVAGPVAPANAAPPTAQPTTPPSTPTAPPSAPPSTTPPTTRPPVVSPPAVQLGEEPGKHGRGRALGHDKGGHDKGKGRHAREHRPGKGRHAR